MSASLRLVVLNIERDLHLDLVVSFLQKENANVVILHELFKPDVALFEKALGAKSFFTPSTRYPATRGPTLEGYGIFTKLPAEYAIQQYAGNKGEIADFPEEGTVEEKFNSQRYMLIRVSITKEGESFRIITTHFPWTPNGKTDNLQRRSLAAMLALLVEEKEFVLCGDFNAPRGLEIFSELAKRYTDNIPSLYTTSLDQKLHRAAPLERMVDGFFSTPRYRVSDVELKFGLSDHAAVLATIQKQAEKS